MNMNINDKGQDKRPVYMGTFSKYTKLFESKLSTVETDVEYHKRTMKRQYERIEKLEKTSRYFAIAFGIITVLAIVMHFISN